MSVCNQGVPRGNVARFSFLAGEIRWGLKGKRDGSNAGRRGDEDERGAQRR